MVAHGTAAMMPHAIYIEFLRPRNLSDSMPLPRAVRMEARVATEINSEAPSSGSSTSKIPKKSNGRGTTSMKK